MTDVRVVVTNLTGRLLATVTDEERNPFLTGSVLLMQRNAADIDPLGLLEKPDAPDLALGFHHLSESDLAGEFSTGDTVRVDAEGGQLVFRKGDL